MFFKLANARKCDFAFLILSTKGSLSFSLDLSINLRVLRRNVYFYDVPQFQIVCEPYNAARSIIISAGMFFPCIMKRFVVFLYFLN